MSRAIRGEFLTQRREDAKIQIPVVLCGFATLRETLNYHRQPRPFAQNPLCRKNIRPGADFERPINKESVI